MTKLYRIRRLNWSIGKRWSEIAEEDSLTEYKSGVFTIHKEERPDNPKTPWLLSWHYAEYFDEGCSSHASLKEAKESAERVHLTHALEFVEEVKK